jgi:2-oxoglutarate ferredoxin oxidoreductase subunit delta
MRPMVVSKKTNQVIIDFEFCKGCGLCVRVCPRNVLGISEDFNSRGYFPAKVCAQEKCIGCGFCAEVCPEVAIAVYKE